MEICVSSSLSLFSKVSRFSDSPNNVATAFKSRAAEISVSFAVTVIVSSARAENENAANTSAIVKRKRVFIIVQVLKG